MEWYERRPADYKEDTWHLTLAEHGAYNLLLDHYYSNEAPLPNDDRALSSICNCSLEEWLDVKVAVTGFFTIKNGKLRKKKCDKIISESFKRRQDGAKRAANYRKKKQSVTRDERVSNASTGQDRTGQKEVAKATKKIGIRIDPDWKPNEENTQYAVDQGFSNGRLQSVAEGFKDHWIAATGKGSTALNWDAKWRTWVRNDIKFNGEPESKGQLF